MDDEEKELVLTLKEANAKPSQIKRVLLEKKIKKFGTQKVKNLITKFLKSNGGDADGVNFEEFMQGIDEHGGCVEWVNDSDSAIKSIYICSESMKNAYISSMPQVVQIDTTFEVDKGRYKLAAVCYLNPTTNKTEIAAVALMSDESQENYDFLLSKFKFLCRKEDMIFLWIGTSQI